MALAIDLIMDASGKDVLRVIDSATADERLQCWLMAINRFMYDKVVVKGLALRAKDEDSFCMDEGFCACVSCLIKTPMNSHIFRLHHAKTPIDKHLVSMYAFRCVICIQLGLWKPASDFYEMASSSPREFKKTFLSNRCAFDYIETYWIAARRIQSKWRRHKLIKKKLKIATLCKQLGFSPNIAHIMWIHGFS